ncbi:hypothetical protein ACFQV8_30810 [Pseudonocardia benzenivorans]
MISPGTATIVGAYNTKQARVLPGETSYSITLKAVQGALADAGLGLSDVDGLNVLPGLQYRNGSDAFGYALGIPTFWVGTAAPDRRRWPRPRSRSRRGCAPRS